MREMKISMICFIFVVSLQKFKTTNGKKIQTKQLNNNRPMLNDGW